MLEHHAHAGGARFARAADPDRLALPKDFACARIQHAEQHLDQRRLAGAVFPEQRVNFTRSDREIDTVACPQAPEYLRQPSCFQKRCFGSLVLHVTP